MGEFHLPVEAVFRELWQRFPAIPGWNFDLKENSVLRRIGLRTLVTATVTQETLGGLISSRFTVVSCSVSRVIAWKQRSIRFCSVG